MPKYPLCDYGRYYLFKHFIIIYENIIEYSRSNIIKRDLEAEFTKNKSWEEWKLYFESIKEEFDTNCPGWENDNFQVWKEIYDLILSEINSTDAFPDGPSEPYICPTSKCSYKSSFK